MNPKRLKQKRRRRNASRKSRSSVVGVGYYGNMAKNEKLEFLITKPVVHFTVKELSFLMKAIENPRMYEERIDKLYNKQTSNDISALLRKEQSEIQEN